MRKIPLSVVVIPALLCSCSDDPTEESEEKSVTAQFTVSSDNNFVAPTVVTFTNESENAASYEWSFGDGTLSDEINPIKTFYEPGFYTVELTAQNDNDTDVRKLDITIAQGTVLELLSRVEFQEGKGAQPALALDSALKYLQLYPDFLATIASSTDLTLFVPSNAAFRKLSETSGFPGLHELNPDVLREITSYHAVDGRFLKADLTSGVSLNSLSAEPGQTISVNSDGSLLAGNSDAHIEIVFGDYHTSNGIVHIIDDVLIPPAVGTYLYQSLNTVAGVVLLGKDFTEFSRLIRRADKDFEEDAENKKITTLLCDISTDWTVLAMHDDFFEIVPDDIYLTLTTLPAAATRQVVLNHLVRNTYTKDELTNGLSLTTSTDQALVVTLTSAAEGNPYGIVILQPPIQVGKYVTLYTTNDARTNGVVYGVFGFLVL